jgi:ATP-dependent helicase/nuclease subunit A
VSDAQHRKDAAEKLDTTYFVEAAAGTGKTTALVSRILAAVKQGRARLHEIVAITFTEKAAGELKIKLHESLEKELTGEKLQVALGDLERAAITTIHSFCASVLRERPVEAVVDPQFAVADEMQREMLLDEAWTQWLENELTKNPVALRQALMREVRVEDLRELAVQFVDHRSQLGRWPDPQPMDVRDVLQRLRELAPTLERALHHVTPAGEDYRERARSFLETLATLESASSERVAVVLGALELSEPRRKAEFESDDAFRAAKRAVKDLKAVCEGFVSAAGHNFLVELAGWLQGFIAHFQKFKHDKALLDFDDLLEKARDLIRDHRDVREQLRQRFKFLLVDEFQDTDPVQVELILALAGDTPGRLFIVGDPKQSIYGFRRADIEMYVRTRREIEKTGQTLQFQQNFRSQSTILKWVNETFQKLIQKPPDGDYQPDYIPLEPKFLTKEPRVTLLRPRTFPEKQLIGEARRAEASGIACYLRHGVETGQFKWGDVALLFRSFTGVEVFADVFLEYGVLFRVVGGHGYYQRQEIQTLVSLLCCLDNPNDKLNLVAVLRSPLFGWTDEQIFLAAASGELDYLRNGTLALLRELHEQRHVLSIAGYIETVFARTHICQAFTACGPDGPASVANLLKALELARALEAAGVRSLRGFVRQLRAAVLGGLDDEPAPATEKHADAVQLLTMHKAKGLEFPVVVLADLAGKSSDSGARFVPNRATGGFELRFAGCRTAEFDSAVEEQHKRDEAEEIRLLYVAATRAKERLVIAWFKEHGERLDLLRIAPEASPLVELPDWEGPPSGGGRTPPRLPASKPVAANKLIAKRREWQTERAALLARAAQPAARTSPSKLGHDTEPREPVGEGRERAMELGVLVHDALERGDAAGLPDKAAAMVERALRSELLQRVRKADEVYRELPFATATMDGKIDLLFREGKRWTLVDYKTDAEPNAERYRQQMQAYRDSLEKVAGIKVSESLLFFLAPGKVVSLS